MSSLKPYEHKYNFTNTIPTEFEINNPNISLKIFNEDNKKINTSNNNSTYRVNIIQLKT